MAQKQKLDLACLEKDKQAKLESLYNEYNKFSYIHPDPLEFVCNYKENCDREIVGLIASSLAYGNVKQILKSVSIILAKMGTSPHYYISTGNKENFLSDFQGFKHRFTTDKDIVSLLMGIQDVLKNHNSLENCFNNCISSSCSDAKYCVSTKRAGTRHNPYILDAKSPVAKAALGDRYCVSTAQPSLQSCSRSNFTNAISLFTEVLNSHYKNSRSYLLPSPKNRSACKRLMLYLRWMIRKDEVDPGCWSNTFSTSSLIIPLDTHMFQISRMCGYTKRKTTDWKTAIEITKNFAEVNPIDPVKYDFSLTRFGIRNELTYKDILLI